MIRTRVSFRLAHLCISRLFDPPRLHYLWYLLHTSPFMLSYWGESMQTHKHNTDFCSSLPVGQRKRRAFARNGGSCFTRLSRTETASKLTDSDLCPIWGKLSPEWQPFLRTKYNSDWRQPFSVCSIILYMLCRSNKMRLSWQYGKRGQSEVLSVEKIMEKELERLFNEIPKKGKDCIDNAEKYSSFIILCKLGTEIDLTLRGNGSNNLLRTESVDCKMSHFNNLAFLLDSMSKEFCLPAQSSQERIPGISATGGFMQKCNLQVVQESPLIILLFF